MDIPNADDLKKLVKENVRKHFLDEMSEFIVANAESIVNGETCQYWIEEEEGMTWDIYNYLCKKLDKKGYKIECDCVYEKEGWMSISKKKE